MDNVKILSISGYLCTYQRIARYFLHQIFAVFSTKLKLVGKYTFIHIGTIVNGIICEFFELFRSQIRNQKAVYLKVSEVFPDLFKFPFSVVDCYITGIYKIGKGLFVTP